MNYIRAEFLISRILSGVLRIPIRSFPVPGGFLLLKAPSMYHRYLAAEKFYQISDEIAYEDFISNELSTNLLLSKGVWTHKNEEEMEKVSKEIEELKVQCYLNIINDKMVEEICNKIEFLYEYLTNLYNKKNSIFSFTGDGFAEIERSRFILALSLYFLDGKPLCDENSYHLVSSSIIDEAATFIQNSKISEKEMRWLATNEPWYSFWVCRKHHSLIFDKPIVEWTEEQKSLITWSSVYDNIREHPECPSDLVLKNHYATDGWIITQQRKKEAEANKNTILGSIRNPKIANSKEICIPAKSKEHAKRISQLNDSQIKKQRFATIYKYGEVKEEDMPDTKLELMRRKSNY
ncbi:MAG: hypothetical protein SNJ71_00350 [Bacteroidales bacterium]